MGAVAVLVALGGLGVDHLELDGGVDHAPVGDGRVGGELVMVEIVQRRLVAVADETARREVAAALPEDGEG